MEHNVYFEGKVQSLGFQIDGLGATVGVVDPGEYDFGPARRREKIQVVIGFPTINGKVRGPGDQVEIEVGGEIKISVTSPVGYLCLYE
jgi:uncharacterized protein YaiE (UPF0345 family)